MWRCQKFAKRNRYYVHCDIVKFFPSVDHEILLGVLARTIADPRLMELIRRILYSGKDLLKDEYQMHYFPGDDLFSALRCRGLPIGNLTSQFFANVLLDQLDHFAKEELRVGDYLRYADNFIFFGDDKRELADHSEALVDFLAQLRLLIHREQANVQQTRDGISFLGFRVFPDRLRLKRENVKRFINRFHWQRKRFACGSLEIPDITRSVNGWIAHAGHAESVMLRRRLMRELVIK